MITLTAKINLIEGDNGSLYFGESYLLPNNISKEIMVIKGVKKKVSNPFILGASKLGDASTFSGGVDYVIGNQLSDENGEFQNEYVIEVYGKDLNSLNIAFDTENNRHPKSINIDDVEYAVDDAIFTISNLLESGTKHIIKINSWNTPQYPLVISGMYVNVTIDIDKSNLISLTSTIFDRGDYDLPSYGIISNTGSLEFNDLDGEVKDYAEALLFQSDFKLVINLNNTLDESSEQVAVMETSEWNYDNNNRSVSVSLQDDLVEWQDIFVEGINYDPNAPYKVLIDGSMEYLYKWLHGKTNSKYKMISFESLNDETKNILTSTKVKYPLLQSGSLWEQWQKLCQVCGLYIYKNGNGETVCSYTYGS